MKAAELELECGVGAGAEGRGERGGDRRPGARGGAPRARARPRPCVPVTPGSYSYVIAQRQPLPLRHWRSLIWTNAQ